MQGRGQALYNSVSFGVGGALGSVVSGLLWSSAGALWTFSVAAGFALLGFGAALLSRCPDQPPLVAEAMTSPEGSHRPN
jgi:PPP family 3-phenylpropionic acid transporter